MNSQNLNPAFMLQFKFCGIILQSGVRLTDFTDWIYWGSYIFGLVFLRMDINLHSVKSLYIRNRLKGSVSFVFTRLRPGGPEPGNSVWQCWHRCKTMLPNIPVYLLLVKVKKQLFHTLGHFANWTFTVGMKLRCLPTKLITDGWFG